MEKITFSLQVEVPYTLSKKGRKKGKGKEKMRRREEKRKRKIKREK